VIAQGWAFDQFHGHIQAAQIFPRFENPDQRRVLDLSKKVEFQPVLLSDSVVARRRLPDQFQGDGFVGQRVFRAVDSTRRAAPK
jgi:hypothetical protein